MKYKFAELVDISKLQNLMEGFYSVTGIPLAVLDNDANILAIVGWQDICIKFHRVNKQTELFCKQSDLSIKKYITSNCVNYKSNISYKCGNGLIDVAAPIIIDGKHLATVYTGQFLFKEPDIEQFRRQAKKYGFNEEEYINAAKKVPIYTKDKVDLIMNYVRQLAEMMIQMGLAKLWLIESQKKAMQESQALVEELRKMDKNKNQFLSMLSHELRNPLASIMMGISFLDRVTPGGEQFRQAKEIIDRQTTQLSRLVDDLLDVTRITQNKISLKKESINLNELIVGALEDYKEHLASKGVGLEVELTSVPLYMEADPARLTQVFGNLINNAAKFTAMGDTVQVSVWKDEDQQEAVICVKDDGLGIKPDILPDLFLPFIQVDSSLDRSSGGLGLGLAIVKGMVELHGGSVAAASEGLGKGAQFIIRLPLSTLPDNNQVKQLRPNGKFSRTLRILVIDDIPDVAEIICSLLRLLGHEVISANSGSEGLVKAKAFHPEILFCDIGMPGMNGYEVAESFHRDNELKDIFRVALTGYAQPEDLERAREAGFNRHLAKPVEIAILEQTLAEVM
jgi:signal transduction histidine kinase/CheY-like chemotaxis protein